MHGDYTQSSMLPGCSIWPDEQKVKENGEKNALDEKEDESQVIAKTNITYG